ncbi:MAG: hypothetical protein GY811_07350 [Myxococcales bacterium]|nr:hypothetical protein [Myxococcales bacterium]
MRIFCNSLICAAALATLAVTHRTAEANCGIDYCPLPEDVTSTPDYGAAQLLVRHVEFSLPEGKGSYLESSLRFEVQRFDNWNFGAWIAPVLLSVDDESRSGLTNPVFFVERRHPLGSSLRLLGGLQVELPLGESHDGIASGHSEVLSYLGALYEHNTVEMQVQAGFAMAVGDSHEHAADSAVFVNPHEDQEAQMRVAVIAPLLDGKLRPGAYLNGRMVIEDVDQRNFLTGALGASYKFTRALSGLGQVEFPLTSDQRFDWRAGAGVAFRM